MSHLTSLLTFFFCALPLSLLFTSALLAFTSARAVVCARKVLYCRSYTLLASLITLCTSFRSVGSISVATPRVSSVTVISAITSAFIWSVNHASTRLGVMYTVITKWLSQYLYTYATVLFYCFICIFNLGSTNYYEICLDFHYFLAIASSFVSHSPHALVVRSSRFSRGSNLHINMFNRFVRVVKSNVNNILNNLEYPEKVLNQSVSDMQNDLVKVQMPYAKT